MHRRFTAALALLGMVVASARVTHAAPPPLHVWILENGAVHAEPTPADPGAVAGDPDRPLPVGSLIKPFLAEAWARAHPAELTPRHRCRGGTSCWRASGHGELGLVHALAVSCNAYFRALAEATPRELLERTLAARGFTVPAPLSPEEVLGLAPAAAVPRVAPGALLHAYDTLVREPWPTGERVRQEVLAGLTDAARSGTASGVGHRAFRAKTGTVAALDGTAHATSGWALVADDTGWAALALLDRGTGREAAARLAPLLTALKPGALSRATSDLTDTPSVARGLVPRSAPLAPRAPSRPSASIAPWTWDPAGTAEPPPVRVALLGALAPRALVARNLGAPAATSQGFSGTAADIALGPGDSLAASLWELTVPAVGLRRRIAGSLAVSASRDGALRVVAEMPAADYLAGVLAAESPEGHPEVATALGAALLRFLALGPRHADAHVCDTTHCAWFVGRGPRVLWPDPTHPIEIASSASRDQSGGVRTLSGLEWSAVQSAAREPGPAYWAGDCGGAPLSAHAIWGNGDRRVWVCPRHGSVPRSPWVRVWKSGDVDRAFGARVAALRVVEPAGVWTLRAELERGATRDLRYDEAHRVLAGVLGWDALPSSAQRVERVTEGFRAEGVGRGHRVGLCIAE